MSRIFFDTNLFIYLLEDAGQRGAQKLLSAPGVSTLEFDRRAARVYAQLRRDKILRALDAIQLACAASARCDLFVTNDDCLSKRVVPGIHFIASLDRAYV